MTPIAPGGGPQLPLRIAASVLVPVILISVAIAYGGWSGWVPLVGLLALLGTLAVVSPRGRVWGAASRGFDELTGGTSRWLERTGTWWGVGMLAVAGFLAMAGVTPV